MSAVSRALTRPSERRRQNLAASLAKLAQYPRHHAIIRASGRLYWPLRGDSPKPGEVLLFSGDDWDVPKLELALGYSEQEAKGGK